MDIQKTSEQRQEERNARVPRSVEEQLRRELPNAARTLDEIERSAEEMGEQVQREIQRELQELCGTGYLGRPFAARAAEGSATRRTTFDRW